MPEEPQAGLEGNGGGQEPQDGDGPGDQGNPGAGNPEQPPAGSVDELPEWARGLIGNLRKENAGHRVRAKEAEDAKAKAEEERLAQEKKWQELANKRGTEMEKAKSELQAMQVRILRQEVAQAAELPLSLADRLQGTTREELEADAQALKKLVPPTPPETPGVPPGPKKGADNSQELDDARKKELRQRYRI